jgi:hypothetical protein
MPGRELLVAFIRDAARPTRAEVKRLERLEKLAAQVSDPLPIRPMMAIDLEHAGVPGTQTKLQVQRDVDAAEFGTLFVHLQGAREERDRAGRGARPRRGAYPSGPHGIQPNPPYLPGFSDGGSSPSSLTMRAKAIRASRSIATSGLGRGSPSLLS